MPHHDPVEPLAETPSREAALADVAAAPIDDAAQLFDSGDAPEDDWGLGAADDGAAPDELAPFDTFGADAKDEDAQDDDLPVSSTLLDPQPADLDDDFVDFNAVVEAEEQPATPQWEPFEDPGNQPITSPPLDAQTNTSHEGDDDLDALCPASHAVPLPDLEQLVGEGPRSQEAAAARPDLAAAAVANLTREGSMSSPEVIEHADAWGFDGEQGEQGGAELLDASPAAADVVGEDVDESQVQHELERPAPHDDSAVQHEAERPLIVDDAGTGPILLPAQDAHPQQRTFSPPPSMVPAVDDDVDEAGWDWQDDAGAEALLDPHVAVTAEGPVPVPSESSVQHEVDRPAVDAQAPDEAVLAASAAQPEPVVEPVSAAPQDEARGPSAYEDVQGAELLQDEPALDVERGAEPLEDESAVQHVEDRPVLPAAAAAAENDLLPAEATKAQHHTFSPPSSALPSAAETGTVVPVVDDTIDDPWDLEPVEPDTPPQPSPPLDTANLGLGAEVLDAGEHESTAAATSPEPAAPSPGAVETAALDEPSAHPLELELVDEPVVEQAVEQAEVTASVDADPVVAAAPDESSVQHEQDRPVVADGAAVVASEPQPQAHTFSLPASSLPAENAPLGAPADPVEVVAPALPASPPLPPPADEGWGWDGEGEGDASRSEPGVDMPAADAFVPPVPAAPAPEPAPSSLPPSTLLAEHEVRSDSSSAALETPAPQHARTMSTDDWGWDAAEPAQDDAPPPAAGAPEPDVVDAQRQASDAPPAPAPPRREKMMVSKQSREVIAIAEEILLEAVKVASPSCVPRSL